jgi:hypothetical protein
VRFQDAARDGRAVVYAAIQAEPLVAQAASLLVDAGTPERVLARAVMNGERTDPAGWRRMFPSLFGSDVPAVERDRAEAILAVSLQVADRGEQVRSQVRGAIVEALAERLIARQGPTVAAAVRRERRVLFDGVRAEIHPYDVTVEVDGRAEAWDCKWGARGIGSDVLHQLDDAWTHAVEEEEPLTVGLVVFDAGLSCHVRLERQTGPRDRIRLVAIEALDRLAEATDHAAGR